MKKIAIVGNSHLAALSLALRENRFADPGLQITFFGAPGRHFNTLSLRNTTLFASTSAARSCIARVSGLNPPELDMQEHDTLVIHGGRIGVRYMIEQIRVAGAHNPAVAFSEAVTDLMVRRFHLESKGFRIALAAARAGRKSIVISETPLLLQAGQTPDMAAPAALIARISASLKALCAEKGFAYLPQPEQTRSGSFTRADYGCGRTDDVQHMNGAYGTEVLQALRGLLMAQAA